jgi:methylated-DNA-[protein]-cysteine S-methyltransferase
MTTTCFTLFETAIGLCGLAWRGETIVGVLLPEGGADKSRARLQRRFADLAEAEPTPLIKDLIERIRALLDGQPVDLTDAPIDMSVFDEFPRKVYEIARAIPPGQALTYGEIAERLGDKLLARDVGQAMGQNPYPIIIPCHRVVAAGGKLGGFSARGGSTTKQKLLAIEGYAPGGQASLF